jgi:hypothetical protein
LRDEVVLHEEDIEAEVLSAVDVVLPVLQGEGLVLDAESEGTLRHG